MVIADHLTLTNVTNSGAFLSMGQTWWQPAKVIMLVVLPIIVLALGISFMMKLRNQQRWLILALSFAIGGGIGNLIDRLLYGSVTDFLYIKVGTLQTGIFNMADVSIMMGIGMLLFFSLKHPKQRLLQR